MGLIARLAGDFGRVGLANGLTVGPRDRACPVCTPRAHTIQVPSLPFYYGRSNTSAPPSPPSLLTPDRAQAVLGALPPSPPSPPSLTAAHPHAHTPPAPPHPPLAAAHPHTRSHAPRHMRAHRNVHRGPRSTGPFPPRSTTSARSPTPRYLTIQLGRAQAVLGALEDFMPPSPLPPPPNFTPWAHKFVHLGPTEYRSYRSHSFTVGPTPPLLPHLLSS
jgi:hypothetical protein